MANEYCRKEQEWLNRHNHTQMGKNSVSYNPINLEYHKNDEGNKLSQDDAKALYRTSMRAAHLYLKNNTFDPLRCQDIPRRLVIDPSETKEFAPTPTVLPASKEGKEGKDSKIQTGINWMYQGDWRWLRHSVHTQSKQKFQREQRKSLWRKLHEL
ncbi:hypothetical protein BDR26DRAFT_206540 [Obelidium mucronatum]|nr:hypothetical protein BDR26DRAFT_206540 [Obelidium mucronatum]